MSPEEIQNQMVQSSSRYADLPANQIDEGEENSVEDIQDEMNIAIEEEKESENLFSSILQDPLEAVNSGLGRFEAVDAQRADQSVVTLGVVPNLRRKSKDTVMGSQVFTSGEEQKQEGDDGNAPSVIINPKPFNSVEMGLAASMQATNEEEMS